MDNRLGVLRLLAAFVLLCCADGRSMRTRPHGNETPIQLKQVELFVGVQVLRAQISCAATISTPPSVSPQTGFEHSERRALMREMWFPDSPEKLLRSASVAPLLTSHCTPSTGWSVTTQWCCALSSATTTTGQRWTKSPWSTNDTADSYASRSWYARMLSCSLLAPAQPTGTLPLPHPQDPHLFQDGAAAL